MQFTKNKTREKAKISTNTPKQRRIIIIIQCQVIIIPLLNALEKLDSLRKFGIIKEATNYRANPTMPNKEITYNYYIFK